MAKVPSDSDLKSRYSLPALPPEAIDQGNLKKLKKVQGKVLETAKEIRELLPDDGVSKRPLLTALDLFLGEAVKVFRTRSAGGEVPAPKQPKPSKPPVTPKAPAVVPEKPIVPEVGIKSDEVKTGEVKADEAKTDAPPAS